MLPWGRPVGIFIEKVNDKLSIEKIVQVNV